MSKFNQILLGVLLTLFILYQLVALIGKTMIEFGDKDIDEVQGDGVRCYLYRENLSCVPDFIPKPRN